MSLSRKLQNWVDASLITADQRMAILEHEKGWSGNLFKNGIAYIAGFSILLGIALMVAANWQEIPDALKLSLHFAVNIVLGALVFIWRDDPSKKIHREGALFALWGLTLTLIALIGQIFQLSGDAFGAVRLWFWITTPMLLYFAQGRYLTSLWAILFFVYVPFEIFKVLDPIETEWIKNTAGMVCSVFLPALFYLLGAWPKLISLRPAMAKTFRNLGFIAAVLSAFMASMMFESWNGDFLDFGHQNYVRYIAGAAVIGILALGYALRRLTWLDPQSHVVADMICLLGAMTSIPYVLMTGNDLLSILHFLFTWLGIGYLAQQQGMHRLVNFAIILVTIRLFVGFLQLFGSLMMSGFGFIIIGLILIALLYGARVVKRKLAGAGAA